MKRSALLVSVAVLGGCTFTSDAFRKELEWKDQEIHDYRFVYTKSCFCGFDGPNPALITVRNDEVAKVEYIIPPSTPKGPVPTNGYPSIKALFAIIADARARGADKLDIDYDETYAFPRSVRIDYEKNTTDDEVEYKVENFTLLSAGQQ